MLECVGTGESMLQALRSTRPGGMVGYVGVPHGVELPVKEMFFNLVGLRGGPAPVRRFLPDLMDRVWNRRIDPARSSTSSCRSKQVADAYRAMDRAESDQGAAAPLTTPRPPEGTQSWSTPASATRV